MANVKWIKIMADVFNNKKIKQIDAMPDADAILVIWFKLLCLAGTVNADGFIVLTKDVAYTNEMLATEFGKPINVIRLALLTFKNFGMVDIVDDVYKISNWEKYQNTDKLKEMREYNRIAKRRERERKRLAIGVNDKSMTSQPCHDTDIDKEEDKEEDKDNIQKKELPYSDEFETFWKAYPKRSGSKKAAFNEWRKLNSQRPDLKIILDAIADQVNWRRNARGEFRPEWKDAERWLKGRMWEAESTPTPGHVPRASPVAVLSCPNCGGRVIKADLTATGCINCMRPHG